LPEAKRRGITLGRVRAAVTHPNRPTLAPTGPLTRPEWDEPIPSKSSAVLVALFEEDGETRVVLTRRASTLRSHTGEVSFPGGRIEPDETAEAAAKREALEEVQMDTTAMEVIGTLSTLSTMASIAGITPVVGLLPERPTLHPDPSEVEFVFDISLAELLVDGIFHEERWDTPWGNDRTINFFTLPHDIIWGATARVLRELLEMVTT